jgi:tetratricopeptide (TPR) repeat protein
MFRIGLVAVIGLITLELPTRALAEDVAAAKLHYERGTALYDLQRYTEAAKEYEAAFEAKNDPALLFNIAQAYRFGGDYAKAITAFRSYLRRVPTADNRAEVEQRITELQKLSDEQKKNQQTPPTGTLKPGQSATAPETPAPTVTKPTDEPATPATIHATEAPVAQRRGKLIAGIAIGAFGVAGLAAGAAMEGLASSNNQALSHPAAGATFNPSQEQALKSEQTAGPILLALGGAALVTGVVLTVVGLRERRSPSRVRVSPTVSHSFVGAAVNAFF